MLLLLTVLPQRVSVGIPYTCGRHCHPPQFNPIRTNPLGMGRDEGMTEVAGRRQTRREKELKRAERIEATLYSKKERGREGE